VQTSSLKERYDEKTKEYQEKEQKYQETIAQMDYEKRHLIKTIKK